MGEFRLDFYGHVELGPVLGQCFAWPNTPNIFAILERHDSMLTAALSFPCFSLTSREAKYEKSIFAVSINYCFLMKVGQVCVGIGTVGWGLSMLGYCRGTGIDYI